MTLNGFSSMSSSVGLWSDPSSTTVAIRQTESCQHPDNDVKSCMMNSFFGKRVKCDFSNPGLITARPIEPRNYLNRKCLTHEIDDKVSRTLCHNIKTFKNK